MTNYRMDKGAYTEILKKPTGLTLTTYLVDILMYFDEANLETNSPNNSL